MKTPRRKENQVVGKGAISKHDTGHVYGILPGTLPRLQLPSSDN